MAKDFSTLEDSNRSSNPSIHEVSDPTRRRVLRVGVGVGAMALLAPQLAGCTTSPATVAAPSLRSGPRPAPDFRSVPVGTADTVVVPPGYTARLLAPWGDPVGLPGNMPAFRPDGSNTAAEQAAQLGMHHDAIEYFALDGSTHGLLVINHEYTDDGLLHRDGVANWSAEKTRKSQAAHGISVVEVKRGADGWALVRPSRYARRLTADSPFTLAGPVAGHALVRTVADPAGRTVRGTLNDCAGSRTPWGTYLAGEENFAVYFRGGAALDDDQRRWGLRDASWYPWADTDERFDAARHPNEFHRFGWIVEVDPFDRTSTPVKRTALGRGAHEGAWVAVTMDGRAVVYSGEDARFEYVYKFVSRDRIRPGGAKANADLLDHGTLYVARFEADGSGRWLPLLHGQGPLTAANGFADQAEVLVKTRQAGDRLGATKMDRPEWMAVDPRDGTVYCTLTNNSQRGQPGRPGVDAANPRANNVHGHVIRWREDGDFDATAFGWDHLVLAGDPAQPRSEARGNIRGDVFACPDGIAFDPRGMLWIQTDLHATQMGRGEMTAFGNNQMLACDVATGEMRRFLTGPVNCEITGVTWTPDARTMFVDIQHPGETPSDRSDPAEPSKYSTWPDGRPGARPRSATVVITKDDGGVIGS
jgi:secreted PhoX family phosphatase